MTQHDTERLERAIEQAAHLLPTQAPLARFVHHNPLHTLESSPFDEAMVEAAARLGVETYLDEGSYQRALRSGRLLPADIDATLDDVGGDDRPIAAGLPGRRTLRRARLLDVDVPEARGEGVEWLLSEGDALRALPRSIPAPTRGQLEARARRFGGVDTMLPRLFEVCRALASAHAPPRHVGGRLRDRILDRLGVDPDALVHPMLIRHLAAYLDQGVAYWPMPDRDGLWSTFQRLHGAGPQPAWAVSLPDELHAVRGRSAGEQVLHELALRGIPPGAWADWLTGPLHALPGWAGMVHQLERHPELAPELPPTRLVDYLAIRLLLDRLAASYVAREAGVHVSSYDATPRGAGDREDPRGLALELYFTALRSGLGPAELERDELGAALAREVRAFDSITRRGIYHLAYERRFRVRVLDALLGHARAERAERAENTERADGRSAPRHDGRHGGRQGGRQGGRDAPPLAQVLCCIDEREESFRRHLEELEPRVETFGYLGHFGVLMRYEGLTAPRAELLCPPDVTPRHRVREVPGRSTREERDEPTARGETRARVASARAVAKRHRHLARQTLVRGGLVALTGAASAVPLVLRTLFPGVADRLARVSRTGGAASGAQAPTRLHVHREHDEPDASGHLDGYSWDEQAEIVGDVLGTIGLVSRFANVVCVVGHGSSTVNNPHAAAYQCGACAGAPGGPNARAFAVMANAPEVRARLAARGIEIPSATVFVGAYHDTTSDELTYFDDDLVPASAREAFAATRRALARACARNAHERCRRFPDAGPRRAARASLRHVRARSVDLAQPRPEYNHATNAVAVIGRRSRTRGLFLDRRAFLASYDPSLDDAEGHVLERVLARVAPVGAGINLEYYFSRVDQARLGCGTKLPHNITGLIGVMDGHGSDLRTGLHWQTVEIHEPMRLLVVVESTPELVARILERNPRLRALVEHRWVLLATIDPDRDVAHFLERTGFCEHVVEATVPEVGGSRAWYEGHEEHLAFARVTAGRAEEEPGRFREPPYRTARSERGEEADRKDARQPRREAVR
ncbi:MAG: DUF2309 domain-containing protein [Myxococcales bacterium]|nr:DUF2309 domain-containing protein [Myxococcales bacterium]